MAPEDGETSTTQTVTNDDNLPDTPRDEETTQIPVPWEQVSYGRDRITSLGQSFTAILRNFFSTAFNWVLLLLRPRWVTVLGLLLVVAVPSALAKQVTIVRPAIAACVLLAAIYWYLRPSEYQLRHRLSDDLMVVPFKQYLRPWKGSDESGGDPAGSKRAAELEMDRSVLVLGETGSGKTEAIKVLAHQMQADPDEAFVIFEYKKDYQEFFDDDDIIRLSSTNSDVIWNVFMEIETSDDCNEIAEAVFAGAEDDYFASTAAQVLADILRLLHMRGLETGEPMTNRDLVDFVNEVDIDTLREWLEAKDLSSKKHIPEGAEASLNIVSNIEERVQKVFTGDFSTEGYFSIREYMADPQGKKLVLDFPIEQSSSVQPIFRLFIDWSIRFGLKDERGTYYILDEFAALPELDMIERLFNAGRAYNCYGILGVQAVPQVQDTYGKEKADSLLSGLAQEIHLRVGDEASLTYWRQRIGRERVEHEDENGDEDDTRVTEEYLIGETTIQNLSPGEGVVHTTEGWQRGQLYMLEDVAGTLLPARTRGTTEEPTDESNSDQ